MSDDSYMNAKKTKRWACPLCVPEFNILKCSQSNIKHKKKFEGNLLIELFRYLNYVKTCQSFILFEKTVIRISDVLNIRDSFEIG